MRVRLAIFLSIAIIALTSTLAVRAEEGKDKHHPKVAAKKNGHERKDKHTEGEKDKDHDAAVAKEEKENPIFPISSQSTDLALFTLALFLALVFLLHPNVWKPILAGLRLREESIKSAEREARLARKEAQQTRAEFEARLKETYAEIPLMMEQARKQAESAREEIRSAAMAHIQEERTKLRQEVEATKDQALAQIQEQAAQLSALISAKAVGREISADEHRRFTEETALEVSAGGGKW